MTFKKQYNPRGDSLETAKEERVTSKNVIEKYPKIFFGALVFYLASGIAAYSNGLKNFYNDAKSLVLNQIQKVDETQKENKLEAKLQETPKQEIPEIDLKQEREKIENQRREDYMKKCLEAIIQIESGGDSNAERYEAHINDTSYGLGQILTKTAKDYEAKNSNLPKLGKTPKEIEASLKNPEINKEYAFAIFKEAYDMYQTAELAIAAYNSGLYTPRNARYQERLNDLMKTNLQTDGIIGEESREAIMSYQKKFKLPTTGKLDEKTRKCIQNNWRNQNPMNPDYPGTIPQNKDNMTPTHVKKFQRAMKN